MKKRKLKNFRDLHYLKSVQGIRLMTEQKTFLFHCHGGKDRTGVLAALILWTLGFTKDEIIRDYLKTNDPVKYALYRYGLYLFGFNKNGIEAVLYNSFAMRPLIDAVFEAIESRYGTPEAFLLQEYGITREQIDGFRAYYLE